jgi:uncharacterized protein
MLYALPRELIMNTDTAINEQKILADTVQWLERAVIGLNLCPFAKAVHVKQQIRYVVSAATTTEALLEELLRELASLQEAPAGKTDTTLLIHPGVLTHFLDYNDFLAVVDQALLDRELADTFQVASLHPHYQFYGTQMDDIDNFTNRAPYPTLHILREDSVSKAVAAFPEAATIFDKNIERLRSLGAEGWNALELEALTIK